MFAPKVAKAGTKASTSSTNKLAPQRSTLAARPLGRGGEFEHPRIPAEHRQSGDAAVVSTTGVEPDRE